MSVELALPRALRTSTGNWRIHLFGALYSLLPVDREQAEEAAAQMRGYLPLVPGYYDDPAYTRSWHGPAEGWQPVPKSFYVYGARYPLLMADLCEASEAVWMAAGKKVPALLDWPPDLPAEIVGDLVHGDLAIRDAAIAVLLEKQTHAARRLCEKGLPRDALPYLVGLARANACEWLCNDWPFSSIPY
jgi:hypothetical protein